MEAVSEETLRRIRLLREAGFALSEMTLRKVMSL
jgi:hypothetical protein